MTPSERRIALDNLLFFGVPDAAAFLGIDARSLRRAIAAGEVPSTKIGPRMLVPTEWLRKQAQVDE